MDETDTDRHTDHMRRRRTSRTTSLTSMSTAAQDNVKIDLSGESQQNFNELLNRANQVTLFINSLFYNLFIIYNKLFQMPGPSAGNIDSRDSGISTVEIETESFEKMKI